MTDIQAIERVFYKLTDKLPKHQQQYLVDKYLFCYTYADMAIILKTDKKSAYLKVLYARQRSNVSTSLLTNLGHLRREAILLDKYAN